MELGEEKIEIECDCGFIHEVNLSAYLWDASAEIQKEYVNTYDAMGVKQDE